MLPDHPHHCLETARIVLAHRSPGRCCRNFGLDVDQLLTSYPVERVLECRVSGGSWSTVKLADGERRTIRRDTHNEAVPEEVFALPSTVLDTCPNVETVLVERIGSTLASPETALDSATTTHAFARSALRRVPPGLVATKPERE